MLVAMLLGVIGLVVTVMAVIIAVDIINADIVEERVKDNHTNDGPGTTSRYITSGRYTLSAGDCERTIRSRHITYIGHHGDWG